MNISFRQADFQEFMRKKKLPPNSPSEILDKKMIDLLLSNKDKEVMFLQFPDDDEDSDPEEISLGRFTGVYGENMIFGNRSLKISDWTLAYDDNENEDVIYLTERADQFK